MKEQVGNSRSQETLDCIEQQTSSPKAAEEQEEATEDGNNSVSFSFKSARNMRNKKN